MKIYLLFQKKDLRSCLVRPHQLWRDSRRRDEELLPGDKGQLRDGAEVGNLFSSAYVCFPWKKKININQVDRQEGADGRAAEPVQRQHVFTSPGFLKKKSVCSLRILWDIRVFSTDRKASSSTPQTPAPLTGGGGSLRSWGGST